MLNPQWAELPQEKKSLASMNMGLLWLCPTLSDPVDCGLLSQGGSPSENTGVHWPVLVVTPF